MSQCPSKEYVKGKLVQCEHRGVWLNARYTLPLCEEHKEKFGPFTDGVWEYVGDVPEHSAN